MRGAGPTAVILVILIAISVALAGVAATIALAERGSHDLRTSLASALRADYSADPTGMTLAPLGGGILESARRDEHRLSESGDGVEIVQVFNPGGAPPADVPVDELTPTPQPTPTTTRAPAAGSAA